MGLTDEAIHLCAPGKDEEWVCEALAACLPTARWAVADPDEPGAVTLVAFGPSAAGWWHLVPALGEPVGIGQDRTVMRRLAKRAGAVLSSTVFDSEVALLSVAGGADFETLASGDWMGKRVGRARAKAGAWLSVAGSDEAVKRVGKLLRGAVTPEDGACAALELLGVDGLTHWGSWREAATPVASVTVREVPRVPWWQREDAAFGLSMYSPAGSTGVSCDEGEAGAATVSVACRGTQPGRLVVKLWGPAVDQGLVSAVSGLCDGSSQPAALDDVTLSFGEIVPEATVTIDFSFNTTTPIASVVVVEANDEVTGTSERTVVPIGVRARCRDGRTRSVRNDWLSVRFRPGTDDAVAWELLTLWLGDPAIAPDPGSPLELILSPRDKPSSVRKFRISEIGRSKRWDRIAGELGGLTSLAGWPSVHAFIPKEGWTGFDYARQDRHRRDDAPSAPHLELQIDRAFSADIAAVDAVVAAAASRVDELTRDGYVVQAVMGRSGQSSRDHYGDRPNPNRADLAWATTHLWSLGKHIWLGPELTARLPPASDLHGLVTVTHLGDGVRIDNADDHDLTRLAPLLAHLSWT